jgi:hypothetical protein
LPGEAAFFPSGYAGETVVWGVSEHDEDGCVALDRVGRVPLGGELGEWQHRVLAAGDPAGQGVREVYAGALPRFGVQRHAEVLQGDPDPRMRVDERGRHRPAAEKHRCPVILIV